MFAYLRPDPPLFDVAAWRARLAELRTETDNVAREDMIAYVEGHLAMIDPGHDAQAAAEPR